MYKVKVTEIGSFVEELLNEKMVVLFGPTAPAELRDICVVHDGTPTEDNVLAEGGTISIGDQVYTIKEFGEAANENMGGARSSNYCVRWRARAASWNGSRDTKRASQAGNRHRD